MCKVSASVLFPQHVSIVDRESTGREHWVPSTDVYSTEEGLVIKMELAGMRSDNLQIMVEGNKLRISGERPDGCRAEKCSFLLMEIKYGSFENILELPPGYDVSQARASYLNGFLRIDVPVGVTAAKRNKVEVRGK